MQLSDWANIGTTIGAFVLANMSSAINIDSDPQIVESAWAVTDSVLLSIKKVAEKRGAQFVIQYVPNMLDFIKSDSSSFIRLREICELQNIILAPNPIDIFNTKKKENNLNISDFYYLVDGHWTDKAHQIVANTTAEYLANKLDDQF